ncbi:MAG: MazG-like family protein [Syntrophomonas sp.]|uniref:MazG-like family protein n=1 Tax=Syntrophomonas sp. TaxID=2053627 RepID=UPI00260CE8F4|nr:MazG-like family protein [Syntrophomonas sp.]MDD2509532.1 MazG-like family protein [Syntrophomonas sp.]MDD3878403.1 MazG-like family protein [Syntrophomonas sp.]MDD4625498.1 MazG-like family protein [Syntrophomonas sp.]
METKTLSLPRLNQLNPTLESTALKLMEEAGELAQVIGKYRGMSGEKVEVNDEIVVRQIARELLDVAQTAITMMFVMEEQFDLSIEEMLKDHWGKLERKGYLSR